MVTTVQRNGALAVVLALALAAAPALATPAQDYEEGRAAFYRDDLLNAMSLLRRAAGAGHTEAQVLLAYILDRAEEDQAAVELYRLAAGKGNADAMFALGAMYAAGEGVSKDEAEAVAWFTRAMELGHEHARLVLANAYLSGTHGLARNPARGEEMLKQGAAAGYEPARERLAALNAAKSQ